MKYKYRSWDDPTKEVDGILDEIEELTKRGWEIVSHSQNQYGMSIFFVSKE